MLVDKIIIERHPWKIAKVGTVDEVPALRCLRRAACKLSGFAYDRAIRR
jgi:hypothetical protein